MRGAVVAVGGGVRMPVRSRQPLQDVRTAVRLGRPVAQGGFCLRASYLVPRTRLGGEFGGVLRPDFCHAGG